MNPEVGKNHQDWETVVLRKPVKLSGTKQPTNISTKSNKQKELESDELVVPKKIDTNLKKSIQQARAANKMSQKQLATALNIPVQTIVQYENGKAIPSNQFISKLERILKTKLPRIKK